MKLRKILSPIELLLMSPRITTLIAVSFTKFLDIVEYIRP
jgi:hypothetical protein